MDVTVHFDQKEDAPLAAAAMAQGTDRATILKNLVRAYLPQPKAPVEPVPDAENQRLIDTLRAWSEEDASDDKDELSRRDAETSEFLRNLEANRLTLRVPDRLCHWLPLYSTRPPQA